VQPVKPPLRQRRQLGLELRSARTLAGMTQRELAERIGLNQPRIQRVEQGATLIPKEDVRRWLDVTEADDTVRERVLSATEAAHTETWPWHAGLTDGHLQGIAATDEAVAVRIRNYAMQWMPGLVQTAAYARALLAQVDPTGTMDIPAAVTARLERQEALYRDDCRFELLFEEAALRWSPADGVMASQLDRLLSVATLSSVDIALLPTDRVGTSGWAPFMLWTPADGPAFVTTELPHGEQVIADPPAVRAYEKLWGQMWDVAARGDDALRAIRAIRAIG
jgi:transcriptional regulator with XRE-family HTH domain